MIERIIQANRKFIDGVINSNIIIELTFLLFTIMVIGNIFKHYIK